MQQESYVRDGGGDVSARDRDRDRDRAERIAALQRLLAQALENGINAQSVEEELLGAKSGASIPEPERRGGPA